MYHSAALLIAETALVRLYSTSNSSLLFSLLIAHCFACRYQCSQCAFSTIHRGNLYAHERHRHPPPVLLAARTGTGTAAVRTLPQVQPHPTTTPSHTRSALTSVSASPFASAFGALPQAVTGSALLLGRSGAPALPADVKADADVLAAPSAAIEAPFASDSPAPLGPSHLDDPFAQLAHFFS